MSKVGEYHHPHKPRTVVDDALRTKVVELNKSLQRQGYSRSPGDNCARLVAIRLGISQHTVERILKEAKRDGSIKSNSTGSE